MWSFVQLANSKETMKKKHYLKCHHPLKCVKPSFIWWKFLLAKASCSCVLMERTSGLVLKTFSPMVFAACKVADATWRFLRVFPEILSKLFWSCCLLRGSGDFFCDIQLCTEAETNISIKVLQCTAWTSNTSVCKVSCSFQATSLLMKLIASVGRL